MLVCALLLGACPQAGIASWSLPSSEREIEGARLDRDAIFDRIDSLEALVEQKDDAGRAVVQWRLAQLYISTDMAKHRRHALELLDEVALYDPDNAESDWLWAELAASMQYHSAVRDRMEEVMQRHPDQVESAIVMARSEFRLGIRNLDEARLRNSRRIWRAAVQIDSTRGEVWHGFAAAAMALGEYRATRRAARSLARHRPAAGLFIEAAANLRLGDPETAWLRYKEALQLADRGEEDLFQRGQGFLNGDDLESIARAVISRPEAIAVLRELGEDPQPGDDLDFKLVLEHPGMRERVISEWWTSSDQRPAQGYSTGELEYWTRLVEADVLFGRDDEKRRGWSTPPGEVWVRWGRPTSTFYDPGGGGSTSRLDAIAAAGVRFPPEHFLPPNAPPIWIWTYRWPGTWISFLFLDRSRSSTWTPSASSGNDLADLRAQAPLRLPELTRREPFDVTVSAVSFPRAGEDALVETYVALEPTAAIFDMADEAQAERLWYSDRDTLALIDWAVFDHDGTQVDHLRRVVRAGSRLSVIVGVLGRPLDPGARDPFVASIGARLPAGRYRIAVEVTEPVTGARSISDFTVGVAAAEPGGLLEMSGLELATAFMPWNWDIRIPTEFVKYTTVIVPSPDHRVPLGSDALGVYFELRNLALDGSGRSNFDVRYSIYASNREIRDLAFGERPDTDQLELVAPASMNFLQERTGVSPQGLVVKGTELDVGALGAGDYVLVVSIHDRIADDLISRAAAFRISSR